MSRRKTKPPHRARLENEVAFFRKELARKDAILLNMTEGTWVTRSSARAARIP